ncbi:MAG: hypothetical protein QHJ34_13895 [bacterium]|jgi:putative alpha-1,2-mannosidase|nr:hypothetical protein [candidate division KSB1 bacterium]MDH7561304.1 hypothetical protein [bacterium]
MPHIDVAAVERVSLVNPLQGTASEFTFSHGNTLPLISRPFAMTCWSPQTSEGRWFSHPAGRQLQGIRATRQPSPWIGDYGQFVLMPQTGRLLPDVRQRTSVFRPDHTVYLLHYFKTYLGRYRVTLELTPTERCAVLRLTFPPGQPCRLIVHPFARISHLAFDFQARRLRGYTTANSGGVPDDFAAYFVISFDCPLMPDESGFFCGQETSQGATTATGDGLGAYVGLQPPANGVVDVRVGTSFIDWEQAEYNLAQELGGRSFDEVMARPRRVERTLGRHRHRRGHGRPGTHFLLGALSYGALPPCLA